jgi:dihydroorotase
MSLYLHSSITPETIIEAAKAGIAGVKSYPAGVTTNSSDGVLSYKPFYSVFAEMERQDLVLNLHGECPNAPGIDVLNAEEKFLPTLHELHGLFPRLRIVLEHCTTLAALTAVRKCGPNVRGTITAHHLYLTIDDVVGDARTFCKPVAKHEHDRIALLQAIVSGDNKFFFGSDSAPHPVSAKTSGKKPAAGVFTQTATTQYVLDAIDKGIENGVIAEKDITVEKVEGFLGKYGREFYRCQSTHETIRAWRVEDTKTVGTFRKGDIEVFLFREGLVKWQLDWA